MPERTPAAKPGRPLDPNAPPKPKRPRDELGRPLAWDSEGRLALEDFDSMSLDQNHGLGIKHFDAEEFFPAHEAWETCWKQAKGTPDAEFFKGLSQLGAGYVHHQRGNPHGAYTLLRRGSGRIARYPKGHQGVDAPGLAEAASSQAAEIEAAEKDGQPAPTLRYPKI